MIRQARWVVLSMAALCVTLDQGFAQSFSTLRRAECSHTFFDDVAASKPDDWQPPQNVFTSSLPYAIPSAVFVLVASQYVKHSLLGDPNQPVFSEAFPLTVVNDTALTLVSHGIATSNVAWLKGFFEGRKRNGDVGFWRRAGANTLLGTAIINLTWLGAGLEVGVGEACGAFGLCAVVYPILQKLKPILYRRIPQQQDLRLLDELAKEFPDEVEGLRKASHEKARELGLSEKEANYLLVTASEAIVTNLLVEERLTPNIYAAGGKRIFELTAELNRVRSKIKETGETKLRNLISKQRQLRRQLFNELVGIYDRSEPGSSLRNDLTVILRLDGQTSIEFSLAFHRLLMSHYGSYQRGLALASVTDMAIAIGFFGGVCLEAVNFWTQTGQVPPVLKLFFGG